MIPRQFSPSMLPNCLRNQRHSATTALSDLHTPCMRRYSPFKENGKLLTWKPALAPVDTSSSPMYHTAMQSLLYKPTVTPRGVPGVPHAILLPTTLRFPPLGQPMLHQCPQWMLELFNRALKHPAVALYSENPGVVVAKTGL
jgi:hypothetical protein